MPNDFGTIYLPFVSKGDDESRIVEGFVSSGQLDCDGQIVNQDWLKRELPPWLASYGNIREQHNPARAVGRAKTVDLDAQPGPHLAAKIVDDDAWRKVKEGVYNGFSIGIKNPGLVKSAVAPNGEIRSGKLIEISIVDRPANDAAKFTLIKAAGAGTWKDMQTGMVLEATSKAATPTLVQCEGCECACQPGSPDPHCDCDCSFCQSVPRRRG